MLLEKFCFKNHHWIRLIVFALVLEGIIQLLNLVSRFAWNSTWDVFHFYKWNFSNLHFLCISDWGHCLTIEFGIKQGSLTRNWTLCWPASGMSRYAPILGLNWHGNEGEVGRKREWERGRSIEMSMVATKGPSRPRGSTVLRRGYREREGKGEKWMEGKAVGRPSAVGKPPRGSTGLK